VDKVEAATMSTEALNRIIKEVNALTPQERRELIDRLAHDEQNSPLREWLTKARNMRHAVSTLPTIYHTDHERRECELTRQKARVGPGTPQTRGGDGGPPHSLIYLLH